MQETHTAPRPMLFFWITVVNVVIGLFWSAFCLGDLLLHPFHALGALPIPALNMLSGLVVGPLTIGVGIVILRRQPGNVVGLLIMLIGESWIASSLRADLNSAWIQVINYYFSGSIWTALFVLVPYFPDGRMYPPRFARVIHAVALFSSAFSGASIIGDPEIVTSVQGGVMRITFANPFFIPALAPFVNTIQSVGGIFIFVLIGLGLFSLTRRIRAGDSHLRAQSRWLLWNMILFTGFAIVGFSLNLYTFATPLTTVFSLVFFTWLLFFPLIGITYAILRHKLYDIDIIIRRTLIYAVLTTLLGVIYFGGIILTQQLFKVVTGQSSDLAIVVSTLLIAALFSPLHRRKYNIETTLASFQQNLRDEVDMDTFKANLVGVVNDTMQPTHIALWIKSDGNRSS